MYKILFSIALFCNFAALAQHRPNIIYIMADDLGYADLSGYGRRDYQTPHLDKLAADGVKFANAYASAPVCTPSRVAFYTGRYPARLQVGLYEPIAEGKNDSLVGLSPNNLSIGKILRRAGYSTYLVGKWHLGYKNDFSPNRNGFDYFFGFHAGAMDYISHSNDLYENETPIEVSGYATELWADKAVQLISKKHTQPYFLAVMFNAPHWPWQKPGDKPYPAGIENWTKGGSASIYAAMMKSLDDAVGRIVQAVDQSGERKNTLIIFTSDNGGERFSDNGPYKGSKMTLWEGGIREPAFVRWPGVIKPNTHSNQVITTFDWTSTFAALATAKSPNYFQFDGMDIMPVILGKQKEKDRTLYWRIYQRRKNKAVRDGDWKYLQDEKGNEYLFNLAKDPTEQKNLKDKNKPIFLKLKKQMSQWERRMLTPIPLESTDVENH